MWSACQALTILLKPWFAIAQRPWPRRTRISYGAFQAGRSVAHNHSTCCMSNSFVLAVAAAEGLDVEEEFAAGVAERGRNVADAKLEAVAPGGVDRTPEGAGCPPPEARPTPVGGEDHRSGGAALLAPTLRVGAVIRALRRQSSLKRKRPQSGQEARPHAERGDERMHKA